MLIEEWLIEEWLIDIGRDDPVGRLPEGSSPGGGYDIKSDGTGTI